MNYENWSDDHYNTLKSIGRNEGIRYIVNDFLYYNKWYFIDLNLKRYIELECSDFVLGIVDMYNVTIADIEKLLVLI